MDDFLFSIDIILPLFLLILLGYLLSRVRLFNESFLATANKVVFNVFLPIAMFNNIASADLASRFDWKLEVFLLAGILLVFLLSCLLVPLFLKDRARIPVAIQAPWRCDYILFVIPICTAIFGADGAAVSSIAASFVIVLFNALAAVILALYNPERQGGFGRLLLTIVKNPLIIGCVLGIVVSVIPNFSLSHVLAKPLADLGGIAVPFALLLLGGTLSFKSLLDDLKWVSVCAALKVVVVPVAAVLIAYAMGFRGLDYAIIMATFASPLAIGTYIQSRNENADHRFAGEVITMTAVLSVVTIFLFIFVSRLLGIL